MLFCPVEQSKLILRKTRQNALILVICTQFRRHVGHNGRNARVVGVRTIGHEQIKLGVFLNFDAEVKQRLNRRVAGEKVVRTRTKGDDL